MAHDSDKSAFNFAVEYLKSINVSLNACKVMSYTENIDGWLKALRTVYRELSLMTKIEEDEAFEKAFSEIYKLVNDFENTYQNKNLILSKLDKLEIKLRKTLQYKGMVLPKSSDPRYAVLER